MLKNVANQSISALILDTAGAIVATGTTTVYITGDNGTQSSGGTATYKANGLWVFLPDQAETNYDEISFLFVSGATDAVNSNLTVFTTPELLATEAKQDIIGSNVDLILVDTAEIGVAGAGLSNIDLPNQTMDIAGSLTGSVGSVTGDINTASGVIKNLDDLDTAQDEQHLITQELVGNIASGSAALGINASSSTNNVAMTETLTYEATHVNDGIYHILDNAGNNIDFEYEVTLSREGALSNTIWTGYIQSNGDTVLLQYWNWITSAYVTEETIIGSNGTTPITISVASIIAYTGTGVNIGKVKFRFLSTDASALVATDRLIFEYTVVQNVLGFVNGSVWIDSINGVSGTTDGIGVIGNPVNNITDAKAIADNYGLKRFNSYPGTELTLTEDVEYYEFLGFGYTLIQAGFKLTGSLVERAIIKGIGTWTDTGTRVVYKDCLFEIATIPPCIAKGCGIGYDGGTLTFGSAGDFDFDKCKSLVAGSGSPNIISTIGSGTTNISNRDWFGGANYTLDSTVTLSHEVPAGGGTTITGGADCEIRGTIRSLTLHLSAAEKVQFVGTTGVITLDGTTSAEVNLFGVASSVDDNTSGPGAVLSDETVNSTNIDDIIGKLPAALTAGGYMSSSITAINDDTQAAINLAASALGIIPTTVAGTPTTTSFTLSSGSVEDVYPKRVMLITSGTYAGLPLVVTAYDGASKLVTFATSLFTLTVGDKLVLV